MFMSKFLLPRKKATNPLIGDHYHFFFFTNSQKSINIPTAKNSGTTPDLGPGSDV